MFYDLHLDYFNFCWSVVQTMFPYNYDHSKKMFFVLYYITYYYIGNTITADLPFSHVVYNRFFIPS